MLVPSFLAAAILSAGWAQPQVSVQQPAAPTEASSAAVPQRPAETVEPPAEATPVDAAAMGVSFDRIQKAIAKPQAIKLTDDRQVFRVSVFGKNPRIEDILGPDYLKGPVPYASMSHQEFLNMVTPKDVQGYAAFSNSQGMIVAATSVALQWALQKALDKYKDARSDRAKQAAQREVQEALDALRRARREAGLPDK